MPPSTLMPRDLQMLTIVENDVPMTEEEIRNEVAINEDELLRALSDNSIHDDMIETIEVKLGKTTFRFRIRPLSEKEWDRCREVNTKYQKNRQRKEGRDRKVCKDGQRDARYIED